MVVAAANVRGGVGGGEWMCRWEGGMRLLYVNDDLEV